ncbi:MAG: sugar phosphate nucleotidyltransferase [Acidimicrobiales bacterium]
MVDSLAALVLAAGAGNRLRPLTRFRPKALCPVGDVALVDRAVGQVGAVVGAGAVAVNLHHGRAALDRHLRGRVHLSVEEPVALGTAGAVAHLRGWLDGRPLLVVNADTWHTVDLAPVVGGWDGSAVRVVVSGADGAELRPHTIVAASLLPWEEVLALPRRPAGLYEACWCRCRSEGRLEVVGTDGLVVPCDRPPDYLAANLAASGGKSVVGRGAVVEGSLVRSVVWAGGVVRRGEVLVEAVRIGAGVTVLAGGGLHA